MIDFEKFFLGEVGIIVKSLEEAGFASNRASAMAR